LQVPLLLAGATLAPGRRTVTAVLRILGARSHRAAWSSRSAAGWLPILLIKAFAPFVIGLDDTIARFEIIGDQPAGGINCVGTVERLDSPHIVTVLLPA
jgi:hypothetical protein